GRAVLLVERLAAVDAVPAVERVQVAGYERVVVRVHDGDRLAAAVADDAVEADLVEAVGVADLGRRQGGRRPAVFEAFQAEDGAAGIVREARCHWAGSE